MSGSCSYREQTFWERQPRLAKPARLGGQSHSVCSITEGTRGPDTKISKYKIFNYILHVLHTGIQWDELKPYKKEIHWSNIYRWHNRWSKDGSYESLFISSVEELHDAGRLDLSVLHRDGSNTVAKKGARDLDIRDISIKKVRKT